MNVKFNVKVDLKDKYLILKQISFPDSFIKKYHYKNNFIKVINDKEGAFFITDNIIYLSGSEEYNSSVKIIFNTNKELFEFLKFFKNLNNNRSTSDTPRSINFLRRKFNFVKISQGINKWKI